jgi:hypothetical protein
MLARTPELIITLAARHRLPTIYPYRLRLTRAAKTSWLLRRCFQDRENLSGQQGPPGQQGGDTPRTFALVVLK